MSALTHSRQESGRGVVSCRAHGNYRPVAPPRGKNSFGTRLVSRRFRSFRIVRFLAKLPRPRDGRFGPERPRVFPISGRAASRCFVTEFWGRRAQ